MSSSGVAISPVTVETTIGKNAIKKVMTTRGRSDAPSVTTMIGATATMGVDWMMTRIGYSVRDSKRQLTSATASGIDTTIATA